MLLRACRALTIWKFSENINGLERGRKETIEFPVKEKVRRQNREKRDPADGVTRAAHRVCPAGACDICNAIQVQREEH